MGPHASISLNIPSRYLPFWSTIVKWTVGETLMHAGAEIKHNYRIVCLSFGMVSYYRLGCKTIPFVFVTLVAICTYCVYLF